jgi:hypothetical protein
MRIVAASEFSAAKKRETDLVGLRERHSLPYFPRGAGKAMSFLTR